MKRLSQLTQTAIEADLVSGNYLAIDGSAGTKKLPAEIVKNITPTENEWLPKENGVQIELVDNPIVKFSLGYYDNSGFHSSLSHRYCEIDPMFVSEISITKNAVSGNVPLFVIAHSDGTYTGYMTASSADATQTRQTQQYLKSGDRLFINKLAVVTSIKIKTIDGVSVVNGLAETKANSAANSVFTQNFTLNSNAGKLLPEAMCYGKELTIDPFTLTPVKTGYYIASDGTEASNSNGAYFAFDAHGIKKITISGSGTGLSSIFHVVISYPNGERQTWVQTNESSGIITIQKGEIATIYINRFKNISLQWKIEYYTKQEMLTFDTRTFPNIVRKPFAWNTKKVIIVGDSIAKGFTSGSTTTAYTWSYWLNQKLGFASLTNAAVGGAAFNDYGGSTIKAQLTAHATDDVNTIFIGAGFNDWMRGATFAEVKAAVDDALDYIFANMAGVTDVIVVTPIEPAGYHLYDKTRRTGPDSLDDIRQAITEAVIEHPNAGNCSVIDGKTFGFPNVLGTPAFISAVFGDRLHPSEKGYADIYAPAMLERIA